jgi:hypothetical protein
MNAKEDIPLDCLEALLAYKGYFNASGLQRFLKLVDQNNTETNQKLTSVNAIQQALLVFFVTIKASEAKGNSSTLNNFHTQFSHKKSQDSSRLCYKWISNKPSKTFS